MPAFSTAACRIRKNVKKRHIFFLLIIIGTFAAGLLVGRFVWVAPSENARIVRTSQGEYSFIDPVLYRVVPEAAALPEFAPLKSGITSYVNTQTTKGNASEVSIYVRDLNSDLWVGDNNTETFWPASMLKVIVLITVLHTSENTQVNFKQKLSVPTAIATSDSDQDFFPPKDPIIQGRTYSIETLLQKLIIESDNNANSTLTSYITSARIVKTFNELNIPVPDQTTGAGITAQQYSRLFRVLYDATYLSPADSEHALQLLTMTTFTQGLVAGVPKGTVVAHKFGETTLGVDSNAPNNVPVHELHDCGIVYYPGHPYFICVMSRGSDYAKLTNVIQEASKVVWQQIEAKYKTK